jgi:hypothetical protein
MSDQRGAERLLSGLGLIFPSHTDHDGLVIVKRGQRAFKITGLTWIVERSFVWAWPQSPDE